MDRQVIDDARALVREFGCDVHTHCQKVVNVLIEIGMLDGAQAALQASTNLIEKLTEINGGDFLFEVNDAA